MYYHKNYFNIEAEWHFFATAHEKGPCDGVGGTLKRQAARDSLQRPADKQITNSRELFEWASKADCLSNITVKFAAKVFYDKEQKKLESRFQNSRRIQALQSLHFFVPVGDGYVSGKRHPSSKESRKFKIL